MPNIAVEGALSVTAIGDRIASEMQALRAIFEQALGEGGFTRRQLVAILRRFSPHCRPLERRVDVG
jgi:hypothetical protein